MTTTKAMPDVGEVRAILVTAYGHIADVLPALPALRALRAAYPRARITVLAVEYVRDMLEGSPYVDEVLILRDFKYKGTRWAKLEQLARLAQLAPRLYRRFDMVLVLHARTRFLSRLAWLTGAPVRAGFADAAPAGALTHPARPLSALASFREENRRTLEAVGVSGMPMRLELDPSRADTDAVVRLLDEWGIGEHTLLIGLHPGSHWTCQQWRVEDWAALADTLVERFDAHLVITGTHDERPLASGIRQHMRADSANVVDATGRTSILQYAALIKRMNLLICVNSAASQVALAVGTRTVNLVGYENPVWTAPMHGEPMTIVRGCDDTTAKTTWCPYNVWGRLSECHRAECVGIGGLSLIGHNLVLAAASAALKDQQGAKTAPVHQSRGQG
ncbi:MAG: glycosyltransferase family 9 protein [Ktedonobacterales bacterium]